MNLSYLDFKSIDVDGKVLKPFELHGVHDILHHKNKSTLHEYKTVLQSCTKEINTVFEVGVKNGGSVLLWNLVFSCKVVGIDCDMSQISDIAMELINNRDIHVYWRDVYNGYDDILDIECPDGIDMVVDDGPHDIRAMTLNFNTLYRRINEGGLYFIEDWRALHPIDVERLHKLIAGHVYTVYDNFIVLQV